MSALEKHINGSDLSNEQLERLAYALVIQLDKIGITDKPMRIKEVADFVGVSKRTVTNWMNKGIIKPHRLEEKGDPFFLRSEIIEAIRKS